MKKIVAIFAIAISLAGCVSSPTPDDTFDASAELDMLKSQYAALQAEVDALKANQPESAADTDNSVPSPSPTSSMDSSTPQASDSQSQPSSGVPASQTTIRETVYIEVPVEAPASCNCGGQLSPSNNIVMPDLSGYLGRPKEDLINYLSDTIIPYNSSSYVLAPTTDVGLEGAIAQINYGVAIGDIVKPNSPMLGFTVYVYVAPTPTPEPTPEPIPTPTPAPTPSS